MADTPRAIPSFAASLVNESPENLQKTLDIRHPAYKMRMDTWQILLDAFESAGGFLSGAYLWPYPREEAANFDRRMASARYHNYFESLVDLYVRFMFTQGVKRHSNNAEYNAWVEDVDGAGTDLTELLKQLSSVALVHGHAGVLVDKTQQPPTGQTKADEQAQVIASVFNALAIADWRFERMDLQSVKLLEQGPAPSILEEMPAGHDHCQTLLWTTEGWVRFSPDKTIVGMDMPNLGLVPLVVLRPKPSYTSQMLGRPLVSNANVIRALYNRNSEEDQALRDGTFSLLTVSVPPDGDVEAAKKQLGDRTGSTTAIVVKGDIAYKTPDQTIAAALRANAQDLRQEIYRTAHVHFERDSLAAESAEAIRLSHSELNEMLQGFSKALVETEKRIARCWFAWTSATPEQAQAAFEAAEVEAFYPEEFFLDALIADLQALQEAIGLGLGETMTKRIKKKAAMRIEPDMPPDIKKAVEDEIDAMPANEPLPTAMPLDRGLLDGQPINPSTVQ